MLSYSKQPKWQSLINIQGFTLGRSLQRTGAFSRAGSGGTQSGLQLSVTEPCFNSPFANNPYSKRSVREEESDNNAIDTFPTGPENLKELLQKHELADLGKYDLHFPCIMKGILIFLTT